MYAHTQPQGVRSFSSRQGDGNVMQMGFCGENFRRQRRDRGDRKNEEKREREEGEEKKNVAVKENKEEERRILGRVEAGGESVSAAATSPPSWDRGRESPDHFYRN